MPNHHNLTQFLLPPMKKAALVLSFCLFWTSIVVGQSFLPFPQDGAMWQIEAFDGWGSDNGSCVNLYQVNGDTLISGLTFQRIEWIQYGTCEYNPNGWGCGKSEADFIAQDSTGKLFQYRYGEFVQPLFDYAANVGDTVESGIGQFFVIDSVDTVTLGGIQRRRWYLGPPGQNPPVFLEGIGTTAGISRLYSIIQGSDQYLRCYSENGIPVYQNAQICPANLDCDQTVFYEDESQPLFQVYPNPTTGIIRIQSKRTLHIAVLYDLQGRSLHSFDLTGSDVEMDLSDMPEGMYILRIEGQNGELFSHKISLVP